MPAAIALTLLNVLAPLLPKLIQGAEDVFKHRKGGGNEKKKIVVDMAATVVKNLRESGMFEGNENIQDIVNVTETVFRVMKENGQLVEHKTVDGDATGRTATVSAPAPASEQKTQRVTLEGVMRFV